MSTSKSEKWKVECTNSERIFSGLITEVQRRRPLWEATHKNYHNRNMLDQLWGEVAKQLKIPKEACKKKWKNLRDRYRIELKKSGKIDRSSGETFSSRWPYFKRMQFVGKFMQSSVILSTDYENETEIVKNQMDTFEEPVVVKNEIEIFKNDIEQDKDSVASEKRHFDYTVSELSNQESDEEETYKTEDRKFEEDIDEKLYYPKEQLTTCEYSIESPKVAESEDLLFFKSLLGYMERFSPIQKLRVRNQITTVIMNELTESTRNANYPSMDNHHIPENNEDSVQSNDTNGHSNKFFEY